jgi:cathepsin L
VESHYAKKTGKLQILSEQNVLDCVPNPEQCGGTGGCAGGTAELAYDWFAANKVNMKSEWKYPYVSWYGKDFSCRTDTGTTGVAITGYTKVPSNKYQPLIEAVSTVGPIAISGETRMVMCPCFFFPNA